MWETAPALSRSGRRAPEALELIRITRQSFFEGIKFARAGNRLNDISAAVQQYAESHGCGVVRDYVGHGIGTKMHEDPEVPNYVPDRRDAQAESPAHCPE